MADIQTFKKELSSLLGYTPTDTNAKELLLRACYDVINRFRQTNPRVLSDFASEETLSNNSGFDLVDNNVYGVLDVTRKNSDDSDALINCNKIPAKMRTKASDGGSIYKALKSSPVFYELNGKLYVLPDPSASDPPEQAYISLIEVADTVTNYDSGESSIAGFPISYNYFIILYTAYHLLLQKAVSYVDDTEIGDAVDAIETSADKLNDFIELVYETDTSSGMAYDASKVLDGISWTAFDSAYAEIDKLMDDDSSEDWEDWRASEDVEMMQSLINGVQARIGEAKSQLDKNIATIQEAASAANVAQSVMPGTDAIQKEISGRLGEIKGRIDEITTNRKIHIDNAMALKEQYERLFVPFGQPKSRED